MYVKREDNTMADALSKLPYNLLDQSTPYQNAPTITSIYMHNDDIITAYIRAVLQIS